MHTISTSVYVQCHVYVLFNAVCMYSDPCMPLGVFKLCRLRKCCLVLDGFLRKEMHGSVWLGRMDAGCCRHLSEHCPPLPLLPSLSSLSPPLPLLQETDRRLKDSEDRERKNLNRVLLEERS